MIPLGEREESERQLQRKCLVQKKREKEEERKGTEKGRKDGGKEGEGRVSG